MRDHALVQTIAGALAADPRVDKHTLAVECLDGGRVRLRGSTEGPVKGAHALRTASAMPGVGTVEDQVRPRPPGRATARTPGRRRPC